MLVFDDPYHITTLDCEVDGELRCQTIGMVEGVQILMVAHTISEPPYEGEDEDKEEVLHIISARKATPQERSIYAETL